MLCKSAKCSSRPWAEKIAISLLVAGVFTFAVPCATAGTVVPEPPYEVDPANAVHFAVSQPNVILDSGFVAYNLSSTWTSVTPVQNQLMLFDVSSVAALGTGTTVVSVLLDTDSTVFRYVPIAFTRNIVGQGSPDGVFCGAAQNDICQSEIPGTAGASGLLMRAAARYTSGTTLQIGIYPLDICTAIIAQNGGVSPTTSCTISPTAVAVPTGSVIPSFKLKFIFGVEDVPTTGKVAQTAGAIVDSALITVQIHGTVQPQSCLQPLPTDVYFPGDGAIDIRSDIVTPGAVTAGAPGFTKVVVIGRLGTVDKTAAFYSANPIQARIDPFSTSHQVTGFTNTTSLADTTHDYEIAYALRDAAGQILNTAASGFTAPGCSITQVRTLDVKGFLNGSKCFIATAAYRSTSAAPVMMLRQFRDEILERFEMGREFVGWYYSWSPGAAEWLMSHPQFRYPVLVALIPIEVFAWLLLHPYLIGVLFMGAFSIWVSWRSARRVLFREAA